MTFDDLRNINFFQSLQKLMKEPVPLKVSYKLLTLQKKIHTERDKIEELLIPLWEKYCVLNDAKTMWVAKEGMQHEWTAVSKEFLSQTVEINLDKIKISDVENAKLSANELATLECLFES